MIKLDRLETHDRFKYFTKQEFSISECCENLIKQRPFGNHPFYIWAHTRTDDDGSRKRLIWQPRLTKPKPQTNSMLFKAYPGTDVIKILWIIPAKEMWGQYEKGKMTESSIVWQSILKYMHNRKELEKTEDDDLSDEQINQIYRDLSLEAKRKKSMEQLYSTKN